MGSTGKTGLHCSFRRGAAAAVVACGLLLAAPAWAERPLPSWGTMERDARSSFRQADDSTIKSVTRVGEPQRTVRYTSTEEIATAYQDVEIVYQGGFGQIEKQVITLHYEEGIGGWAAVGFKWGDRLELRPGRYPPAPAPPPADEVEALVRDEGMAKEWRVRPEHVEKVKVSGKPELSWEGDKPTAYFDIPVKVFVQDLVDRPAEISWRTRWVCDAIETISLERELGRARWKHHRTDASCGNDPCELTERCQDLWQKSVKTKPVKAKKKGKAK